MLAPADAGPGSARVPAAVAAGARGALLHPFLFALQQPLFLLAHNVAETGWRSVWPSALVALAAAGGALLAARPWVAGPTRRAVLASLLIWLFFSYGHLHATVDRLPALARHRYLLPLALLAVALAVHRLRRAAGDLRVLTGGLNTVALALVLATSLRVAAFELHDRASLAAAVAEPGAPGASPRPRPLAGPPPDVWFIVLDRYGDAETLDRVYGLDNRPFLDELTRRGFFVARQSRANYLSTRPSIAATLHLDYHHVPAELRLSRDASLLDPLLEDYPVWRFFKAHGYRFVHAGSFVHFTKFNRHADLNINYFRFRLNDDLLRLLLENSLLVAVQDLLAGFVDLDALQPFASPHEQHERELYKFHRLAELASEPGPKFVFAHFLLPHSPYVFDRDGSYVEPRLTLARGEVENYGRQLHFTNILVLRLVEALLAGPGPRPAIIIQGDHGPYPPSCDESAPCAWRDASAEQVRTRAGILNVLHLPGIDPAHLYDSMSPVNTFRLLFRDYFGEPLELLPDEVYAHEDPDHPWAFFSVTERVRGSLPGPLLSTTARGISGAP